MNNEKYQKIYGINYNKCKPDFERCCAEVASSLGWNWNQCSRKRGYGTDEAYCKQHAKNFPAPVLPRKE